MGGVGWMASAVTGSYACAAGGRKAKPEGLGGGGRAGKRGEAEVGGSPWPCGWTRSSAHAGSCGAPWTPRTGTLPGPRCRSCRRSRCSPAGGVAHGQKGQGRVWAVGRGEGGGGRRLLSGYPPASRPGRSAQAHAWVSRGPLWVESQASPRPAPHPWYDSPEQPPYLAWPGLVPAGGRQYLRCSPSHPHPQARLRRPPPKSRRPGMGSLPPSAPNVAAAALAEPG